MGDRKAFLRINFGLIELWVENEGSSPWLYQTFENVEDALRQASSFVGGPVVIPLARA